MSRLIRSSACSAVVAGLTLLLAADATAQRPGDRALRTDVRPVAVKQSPCTVEIQMAGETLATGAIGPESMGSPVDRRARGAVGPESWSWGMSRCTPDQLRNVSADDVWVPVGDVAAALGDRGGLRVDRGRLTVSRRPVAGREPRLAIRHRGGLAIRDPGTRTLDKSSPKLAVTPDFGESAVISSNLRWFAAAEDEEEVQTLVMRLSDLGGALGIEPGDMFIEPGDLFIGLKFGPGAGCTLCAFDAFLD